MLRHSDNSLPEKRYRGKLPVSNEPFANGPLETARSKQDMNEPACKVFPDLDRVNPFG